MVTVGDIYNYIDTFAPFHTAMGFDNVGLLVGGKHCPVTSVMVSMDITPEVISEAVSQKAELIISHHPVIFQPLKRLSPTDVPYLLVKTAYVPLRRIPIMIWPAAESMPVWQNDCS